MQTKCAFHSSRGKLAESMCPICSDCQSPSNEINEDTCVNCWNCLKDEGYVRKGLPKALKEKIKQALKDKIIEERLIIINKLEK